MSEKYGWAVNPIKLQRAIENVRKTNPKEVTDEAVKAEYVKMLGLVREVAPAKDRTVKDDEPKTLEDLTVLELRKLADEKEVDLGDATRKDDIVAVLVDAGVTL